MFNCDQVGEYTSSTEGERDTAAMFREYPDMLRPMQPTVHDVAKVLEEQYKLPRTQIEAYTGKRVSDATVSSYVAALNKMPENVEELKALLE